MRRITHSQRLRGRLTTVGPGLVDVELQTDEESPFGTGARLASQLSFGDERRFREQGTLAFADDAVLRVSSLGRGDLGAPGSDGVRHGTAVLEACGVGRLAGINGRITSNFVVGADGVVTDEQVVVLFIETEEEWDER
jgi:hypothetical protein